MSSMPRSFFKTLNPSTFAKMQDNGEFMASVVETIDVVSILSGWTESRDAEDFPLGADGQKWVERYLYRRVKPHVVKYDEKAMPIVVRHHRTAVKTRSSKEIARRLNAITVAAYVHGQCLAQELGGCWIPSDHPGEMPGVQLPGGFVIQPHWKPAKFCCFGQEDSLQKAAAIYRQIGNHTALVHQMRRVAAEKGLCDMSKVAMTRTWADDDGQPYKVQFLDQQDNVLLTNIVQHHASGPDHP